MARRKKVSKNMDKEETPNNAEREKGPNSFGMMEWDRYKKTNGLVARDTI